MPGIKETLHEYKAGQLHSGSKKGPLVTNRKQAIAIGLSQQRKENAASPQQIRKYLPKAPKGR